MVGREWWAACAILCLSSACSGSSVTDSTPSQGPYGTLITVTGDGLESEQGRIVFGNGVALSRDDALVRRWTDDTVQFVVPTPARGAFRLEGDWGALDAGSFEPSPWRPLALSVLGEGTQRLDWVALDAHTVAEAISVGGALEVRFTDEEGSETVSVGEVEAGSAVLLAQGSRAVGGFFFDPRDERFGWFEVENGAARVLLAEEEPEADALLGADRDALGAYAWLGHTGDQRMTQWRVIEGALVETLALDDPADNSSSHRRFAARGRHAWRVWSENRSTWRDDYFVVQAAYLGPDGASFAAAGEIGSGDDGVSLLALHGVSEDGETAVEFCGTDVDPIASTVRRCTSMAVAPGGVLEVSAGERAAERSLYYAFDRGVASLECVEGVHALAGRGATLTADPVFAPCQTVAPRHSLDPSGVPTFAVATPERDFFLSRP